VLTETRGELRTQARRPPPAGDRAAPVPRPAARGVRQARPDQVPWPRRHRARPDRRVGGPDDPHGRGARRGAQTARRSPRRSCSPRSARRPNQRLYLLAIITAVFLPLGFVCSLLGVNVGRRPAPARGLGVSGRCAACRGDHRRADLGVPPPRLVLRSLWGAAPRRTPTTRARRGCCADGCRVRARRTTTGACAGGARYVRSKARQS